MVKQKSFDPKDLIQPNSFVEISTGALLEKGIEQGELIYVSNLQAFPIDENDLYTQRLHVVGHRYLGQGLVKTDEILLLDPNDVKKIKARKNKKLIKAFTDAYFDRPKDEVLN